MKKYFLAGCMPGTTILQAQNTATACKPLGPFCIHKTVGLVEASGLGVMRSLDVSVKNPDMILISGMSNKL